MASTAASARVGVGVDIGVPAYGYVAPPPVYPYPSPYYYDAPPYYGPAVDAYYGPYVGIGGVWYDHWGHRHYGGHHR